MCDFETIQKKTLNHHEKNVHNPHNPIIECNQCTFSTRRKDKLAKHIKVFHNKARKAVLCCDLCDFETVERKTLNHHKKLKHTDGVTLKCQECSFVTKEKKLSDRARERMAWIRLTGLRPGGESRKLLSCHLCLLFIEYSHHDCDYRHQNNDDDDDDDNGEFMTMIVVAWLGTG